MEATRFDVESDALSERDAALAKNILLHNDEILSKVEDAGIHEAMGWSGKGMSGNGMFVKVA